MLRRCGLGDKKLRTLLAALRTCGAKCTLLSLDLSHNVISDAGAVALCAALAASEGAGEEATTLAPALTQLSLVGNPLGKKAIETCARVPATHLAFCLAIASPSPRRSLSSLSRRRRLTAPPRELRCAHMLGARPEIFISLPAPPACPSQVIAKV